MKLIIRSNGREFSEEIDLAEVREHYAECVANGANPHLEKISFEQYTCPAMGKIVAMDSFNGKHFIFGHLETLFQSDQCPQWIKKDDEFELIGAHKPAPQNPTQTPENTILIKQWKADMDAIQSCVNYWRQRFEKICASRPSPSERKSAEAVAEEFINKISEDIKHNDFSYLIPFWISVKQQLVFLLRAERGEK